MYFASSLSNPNIGGGINIKTKDQDFSMSRKLYLQSSYDPQFNPEKTVKLETHLGYVLAEMKTNELLYSFKDEFSNIENKNLKEETLLEKDNFRKIADRKNDAYFANNF